MQHLNPELKILDWGNILTLLELKNIAKVFDTQSGPFEAVQSISFTIDHGQIVALLGPNGAGKTTTVQMIAGYLEATRGTMYMGGQELTQKNRRHSQIGVVLGGELGFYGNASAWDNLVFFSHLDKISRSDIKREVKRVLSLVDLSSVAQEKVYTFSRGMRQRLHIARSLLSHPQLLLLDEPTTGLDVEISKEIQDLVKQLAQEEEVGILLTSHQMSEVEYLADEILLLGDGKIQHKGNVESIVALSKVTHVDRPATLEESYLALASQLKRGPSDDSLL